MQVCLVESFHGGSHRAWADGYAEHSAHDVELVTLPGENWRWRMRGGAVALSRRVEALAADGWRPDVVLVSDMLDLALFRALTFPMWGAPPMVLYFHENQLMYPSKKQADPAFGFINWSSALVADEIWFNSEFHRSGFLEALPKFLERFPDGPHDPRSDDIADRSRVLPVGVDLEPFSPAEEDAGGPPVVLWNHRWEHDKRPGRFGRAILALADEGLDFEVVICGEEPLGGDPFRDDLERGLSARLRWSGYADRSRYVDLVNRSDIVVSTADHEFFGVAMVEALAARACPVVPDRLSYPELIPAEFHREALYQSGGLVDRLRDRLDDVEATRDLGRRISPGMGRFDWRVVAPRYDASLEAVAARGKTC